MNDSLLRRTLWGNAVFSVVSGAALAIFATRFAAAASSAKPALLGVGVIAFGGLCAWVARQPELPRGLAQFIFVADIVWVLGSALVLALPASWTTSGVVGIVVLALIVADLAVLEYLGLRRLNRTV